MELEEDEAEEMEMEEDMEMAEEMEMAEDMEMAEGMEMKNEEDEMEMEAATVMEEEEEDVVKPPELMLLMLNLLLEAMKSKELLSSLQSIISQQVNNMQLFKYLPLKGVSLFSFS